jgi:hypothetical protein
MTGSRNSSLTNVLTRRTIAGTMDLHTLGFLIVAAIFFYGLYKAILTRNWGTFNRTSMLVWGGVLVLVAATVIFIKTLV